MFRVGAGRYSVRVTADPIVVDGVKCMGFCDDNTRTILVSPGVPPARRLNVLLHELGHAHMFATGCRPHDDEGICDFVANVAELAFQDLSACGGLDVLKALLPGEELKRSTRRIVLSRSRSCHCEATIPPGEILCHPAPDAPDQVELVMYCEHCNVTTTWRETTTFGGFPSGYTVGTPTVRRGGSSPLAELSRDMTADLA